MKPRSKLLKRNYRVSEQGTNRSKETREFRKRLENLKAKSKLLERNYRVSEKGANRSKETRASENKEQTARKDLENFRTRSKPLERDFEKFNRDSRN